LTQGGFTQGPRFCLGDPLNLSAFSHGFDSSTQANAAGKVDAGAVVK
jgi:hypothetical protein